MFYKWITVCFIIRLLVHCCSIMYVSCDIVDSNFAHVARVGNTILMITHAVLVTGHRAAQLSTFRKMWRQLCPHIVCCRPQTDLCWECQKNIGIIHRAINCPEDEKSARLRRQEAHLVHVVAERALYRTQVTKAKDAAAGLRLGENCPCSRPLTMHYSFDFAQQVHYPCDPLQPGPIYFLTPRRCGIFGVCFEGLPQQVNYLIDEGMATSKGSDAVISYLHHFFSTYGLGEEDLQLHCDNCSGQNKNRYDDITTLKLLKR